MRNIFLCLLLANLGFFAYHQSLAPAGTIPRVTSLQRSGVGSIELVHEVKHAGVRNRQLSQIVNNAVYEAPRIPAVVPLADAAVTDPAVAAAEPGWATTAEVQCTALGPLADLFAAQNFLEKLRALGLDVILQAIDESSGGSNFRVIIPPAKTLQDAFRKVLELKSSDIDAYVITQGEDALGISLGLFASLNAAQTAQGRFNADGYTTQLREITQLQRTFWVFAARAGEGLVVDPALWESILDEFPQIQQINRRCPENKPGVV